jgi:U3 small nucleolar RNA-associated protein 10
MTVHVTVPVLQTLFLTRHKHAWVRGASVRTLIAFATVVGGEFLTFLPETLPFVSELMEDDSREVEALCHTLIRRLEDLSGESLQEYLRK